MSGTPGTPRTDDLSMAAAADVGLAEQLDRFAHELATVDETDAILARVVGAAVRLVPGAEEASVTAVAGPEVRSANATGDAVAAADLIQVEVGEGPCLDAARLGRSVLVPDLGRDERWPAFVRAATEAGVGSMLSVALPGTSGTARALNLVSRRPSALDGTSASVALLLATHTAVAVAAVQRVEVLQRAIASRDVIGQAKGMLMQRYQLDATEAFRVLVRASQGSQRKLRDLAEELVSTRDFGLVSAVQDRPATTASRHHPPAPGFTRPPAGTGGADERA